MKDKEIEISKRFKRTSEIAEPCYMGNQHCATCMHCISDRYSIYIGFEYCYCAKARREPETEHDLLR